MACAAGILTSFISLGDVAITEFAAGNTSGLKDENGEAQDWIELQNRGTNAVDLLGWSLTDERDKRDKWMFPSRALNPGQFIVVFASGKDRRAATGANRFHTNFKLNVAGEYLALCKPGPRSARIAARQHRDENGGYVWRPQNPPRYLGGYDVHGSNAGAKQKGDFA